MAIDPADVTTETVRARLLSATPEELRATQMRFDPVTWAVNVARIMLPKGQFSFRGREFMLPVYRDLHHELVIIKGAQMGFSTMAIIRTLWALTTFPMSVIYCVDDVTELLSQRGWLKWNEVRVGENILTFDRDTNSTRWSPVEEVFVKQDYKGPMVHMQNRQFDALVTPNHRWLARPLHGTQWHFYEADTLPDHQMIPLIGPHGDFPTTAVYTNDFVELAAWTVTEGHYRRYAPHETTIVITQKDGAKADRIRDLLHRVGSISKRGIEGPVERRQESMIRFWIDGPPANELRRVLPTKELTVEFVLALTQSQLSLLVETMLDGDGDRSGREMFHQKSKVTTDAFAMACMLLGRAVTIRRRTRSQHVWYEVRLRRDRWAKSHRIRRATVAYEGVVWCPRTRDETFFMRHGASGPVLLTANTFPTKGDVSTFTAARINPIIAASVFLSDRIQDFDSVGMKQFARVTREEQKRLQSLGQPVQYSTVYFNGAQNPKDATSVDADLLIHDEEDRSDPQTIEEYQSRLYASRFKWLIRLSTPTIPGAGIDRQWKRSDMRHWLVKCSRCNSRFEMDFPQNITPHSYKEVLDGAVPRYICHVCGGPLSEADRGNGVWVAERPNIPVHGYSINQMAASWVPARSILEQESRATFKQAFYNLVMARPYQEGTNAMTREAILNRQNAELVGTVQARMQMGAHGLGCTMGIDVGKYLDVVIGSMQGGVPRTIEMKRLTGDGKWGELDQLMTDYGIVNAVIDSQPEDHMAHVFANKWPGRVWRCRYSDGRIKEINWDDKTHTVSAPRTEILTRSSVELLTTRILPKYDNSEEYDAYITHHENSKKVPVYSSIESVDQSDESVDRERQVVQYKWVETGPDHFFHAATYEMLARMGYQVTAGLPSIGLRSLDRSKILNGKEGPVPLSIPLLLPTLTRRARRRY